MPKRRTEKLPKWLFRRKDSPNIWYKFTVKVPDPKNRGRLIRKTFTGSTDVFDVAAAEKEVGLRRSDAVAGRTTPKQADMSLAELVRRYLESCRKQKACGTKEDGLRNILASPRFKGKAAAEITRDDVKWYQVWRTDFVKQSTVNRELGNLRNCYNVAITDMNLQLENPVAKVKFFSERKFERKRFMGRDEKDAFFSDPQTSQRCKDVVMFDIKEGLRQGELIDLQISDCDFQNQLIKVRAGDEDRTRFVPMHPEVEKILKRWTAEAQRLKTKWVFHNDDGSKLTRHGWVITSFKWACKRGAFDKKGEPTGRLGDLHFHDLRHTFASDFIMAGGDFKTLAEYMGHSVITVTERYAHLTPKYKASQILLLPTEKSYPATTKPAKDSYDDATQPKSAA